MYPKYQTPWLCGDLRVQSNKFLFDLSLVETLQFWVITRAIRLSCRVETRALQTPTHYAHLNDVIPWKKTSLTLASVIRTSVHSDNRNCDLHDKLS